MPIESRLRALALPAVLAAAMLVPASADAAFVTAVDVAVRPAEGSPWSKGTLFRNEGFSVSTTTSNGWAWGRAGGGADRCGWVLISELNSTNPSPNSCGAPTTEPLGDSEHVPGGGPSERWYVICDSATLHGNYGGGPGQLRNEAGTVTKGTALGWRYTTGDNYAASVDGPTGTPRFILRSCISRTPPMGPPAPGPGPGPAPVPMPSGPRIGPPPYRVFDEERAFGRGGPGDGAEGSAKARGAGPVMVSRTRATIRLSPGTIVIANGLKRDAFESSGKYCKGWFFGTVTRGINGPKHTGWVQRGSLSGEPRASVETCGQSLVDFRSRIGFVNAPFRSIAFRPNKTGTFTVKKKGKKKKIRKTGLWTTTGAASQVHLRLKDYNPARTVEVALKNASLADGCELYLNREPGQPPTDQIKGDIRKSVFKGGDMSSAKGSIGYRYTTTGGTTDPKYALVAIKSGYGKPGKDGKPRKVINVWAFVDRTCVEPLGKRPPARGQKKSNVTEIYHPEIRVCYNKRFLPSRAVRTFNRRSTFAKRLAAVGKCRMANGDRKRPPPTPERPFGGLDPDDPLHGWEIGRLP